MFADREEAGRQLAEQLSQYHGKDALVLALPRGGVVLGAVIARVLSLPLDIIAVRKIGHPSAPEFALGAVDEECDTGIFVRRLGLPGGSLRIQLVPATLHISCLSIRIWHLAPA